jgi:2-methylaconitate cis-trans-isomerase PrpF
MHYRKNKSMQMGTRVGRFSATFARGDTSNGLIVLRSNLPEAINEWPRILLSAMGSPDPHGRQLDGMGSGVSSTSKVCVINASQRPDADIDYTSVQIGIRDDKCDMAGNFGNMSSVVGPIALDEDLVSTKCVVTRGGHGREATVRVFNTNTSKMMHSTFAVDEEVNLYHPFGDYEILGIPGRGSCIILSFLNPAGSKTSKMFSTGSAVDQVHLPNGDIVRASLIDIANPSIFMFAEDLGVEGDLRPDTLDAALDLMGQLEQIR